MIECCELYFDLVSNLSTLWPEARHPKPFLTGWQKHWQ